MTSSKRFRKHCMAAGAALILALGMSAAANASGSEFGVRLTGGIGTHGVDKADLGLVWDPDITWWDTGSWHFALLGEAHVARWFAKDGRDIYAAGVTPVVRFIKNSGSIRPYIEGGVGIRFLSHPTISDDYTLSTSFQFSDVIGVGAQFGGHQQYEVGYRFHHISNAGIKEPNPGINFNELYFQYNF